jgi:hypothetical protein
MTTALAENARRHSGHEVIRRAILKLSIEGYVVEKATSGQGLPSLKLERPYEALPAQLTRHGDKTIGSVVHLGCRLYWLVADTDERAA